MLWPSDVDHETFLDQGLSDPLPTMRTGSAYVAEYTYVVDFASVVFICRSICNTAEPGKETLRKHVERVAGYFLFVLPLAHGCMEVEEVFHGSKIGGLYVLLENPVPVQQLRRERAVLSRGILFHFFTVPAEIR
jgi:hypothetical protein